MTNVYYSPEKFGLTVVGEVENGESYEFDTFVVWQDKRGDYLWAKDSGCSCPTPFESFDLSNLPVGSARDALTDLDAWIADDYSEGGRAVESKSLRAILEERIK